MDNKAQFLIEAMKDTQSTIRAVDAKVGTLAVLLLLPFSSLGRIFEHLDRVRDLTPSCLTFVLVVAFVFLWLYSLLILIRAISAIDNPARHVTAGDTVTGGFYGGGLYSLSMADALLNRTTVLSRIKLPEFIEALPSTPCAIEKELAFEHMKLIYIREVKLNRLRWGLRFSAAWLGLGILLYFLSRYSA